MMDETRAYIEEISPKIEGFIRAMRDNIDEDARRFYLDLPIEWVSRVREYIEATLIEACNELITMEALSQMWIPATEVAALVDIYGAGVIHQIESREDAARLLLQAMMTSVNETRGHEA